MHVSLAKRETAKFEFKNWYLRENSSQLFDMKHKETTDENYLRGKKTHVSPTDNATKLQVKWLA